MVNSIFWLHGPKEGLCPDSWWKIISACMCLRGCFWKRLAFDPVDWIKRLPSIMGIVLSVEGPSRTKRQRKDRPLFLSFSWDVYAYLLLLWKQNLWFWDLQTSSLSTTRLSQPPLWITLAAFLGLRHAGAHCGTSQPPWLREPIQACSDPQSVVGNQHDQHRLSTC